MLLFVVNLSSVLAAQTGKDGKQGGGSVSDSLSLDEVVVEGARTYSRDNALHILPTQAQKDASATGYGLLSRLALPYVTVDEVAKSVTVPPELYPPVPVV